jgi:hypothetical protein
MNTRSRKLFFDLILLWMISDLWSTHNINILLHKYFAAGLAQEFFDKSVLGS